MADTSINSLIDGAFGSGASNNVYTPGAFAQTYQDAANYAGNQLGVDPTILLGQWGLETGYGKSVIPGTSNLGNIKSKNGVSAVDNQTGSTDQYQSYSDPMDFAKGYVNLIKTSYPKAVGQGSDSNGYFNALKAGGYAQDQNYVSKGVGATLQIAKASVDGNADVNSLIAQAFGPSDQSSQPSAAPQAQQGTGNFFNDAGQALSDTLTGAANAITHPVDTAQNIYNSVKGNVSQFAQHPLDYSAGWANKVGNLLTQGIAAQANANPLATDQQKQALQKDADSRALTAGAGVNPDAYTAGGNFANFGVSLLPTLALGPEAGAAQGVIGRTLTAGAKAGAANAIQAGASTLLNGGTGGQAVGSALGGALVGAPLGVAGSVAGQAIGKGAQAATKGARSAEQAAANAEFANAGTNTGAPLTPQEQQMAKRLVSTIDGYSKETGQTAQDVANQIDATPQNAVSGYQPTAAEVTQNPVVQNVQQGLNNSGVNAGLTARKAVNAEAQTEYLKSLGGSEADINAFNQQASAQAGQLGQVSDQSAFNTPAMQNALGRANKVALDDGSNAVQSVLDQPNADAVTRWDQLAGTPQLTANLEIQRKLATGPLYQKIFEDGGPQLPVDGQLAKMLETPAMQKALDQVQVNKLNALDQTPVMQQVDGQAVINANDLNQARMALDKRISQITADPTSSDKFMLSTLSKLRDGVNTHLENNVPGLANANNVYKGFADQMAASKFLTSQNMVSSLGQMNLPKLDALIKSIEAGHANLNEFDPAKTVSTAKLGQLRQLRSDLQNAANQRNAVGLQGQGYNYVNRAVQSDPQALEQYQQYLRSQGQAGQNLADTQQALAQHQNYQGVLQKFDTRADGNVAWNDVKNLGTQQNQFTPQQMQGLQHVRGNLENINNMVPSVRGSDTAANLASRNSLDKLTEPNANVGGLKGFAANQIPTIARSALGSFASVLGHAHAGPIGAAVADMAMDKLGTKMSEGVVSKLGGKAEEQMEAEAFANKRALEGLMLNPQRLADALRAADKHGAVKAHVDGGLLKGMNKASSRGGLLGAIGANAAINSKGQPND